MLVNMLMSARKAIVPARTLCLRVKAGNSTVSLRSQLRSDVKHFFVSLLRVKNIQIAKFFRISRIATFYSASGFLLFRKAFCKHVTGRANPLRIQAVRTRVTWSDLWKLIRPYVHWLIIAALGALAVALLNIQIPILLGRIVNIIASFLREDAVVRDFAQLQPIGVQLMLLYVGQAFFTLLYITALSIMGERMAADLRVQLFGHLMYFDMDFYDERMTGELSDRLNYDVQEFKSCFKSCIAQGLRTTTQTAGCMVSLYLMSPKMAALTVGIVPMVIFVGSLFGVILRRISNAAQMQNSFAMGIAVEAFSNIRTVKEFAMEDAETNLFHQQVEKSRVLSEELGMGIGLFQAATNIFLNGIVLGVLYGGARLIVADNIAPGDLMSFLVNAQTIQRSLTQLSLVFGNAIKGYTACARVHEFLKIKPSNITGSKIIPYHTFLGNISFEDVNFAYTTRPDHKVVNRLNLQIENGKTIALCGPSGSGKSTIAALIERLYDPKSGRITLDDVDLKELDPYWLRKRVIGVISQEPVLFATTVEENIRYGRVDATDEEVRLAAAMANADKFIEQFPKRYKTLVGERGVALSGGQKQRIAIARALLKNPPILILDEATSALDAESEKMVQEALDKVLENRTVIIIAHRLSTIRNADLICVIQNGRIIEKGKHAELLRRKGAYYDLVNLQNQASDS